MKYPRYALVALALVLVAGTLAARQQAGPIRLGFIVPLSGPSAQNGRDILDGLLLYLEEIGYRAAGREIELIVEDTEGIPAVALTKTRKLVEADEVHLMGGRTAGIDRLCARALHRVDADPDGVSGGVS